MSAARERRPPIQRIDSSEAPMTVRTTCVDGDIVVWMCGEIDVSNVERLRATIDAAVVPGQRLVLDMGATTFMGACGVQLLAETFRRLGRDRAAVVVRRPSPPVRKILRLTAVERLVTIDEHGPT